MGGRFFTALASCFQGWPFCGGDDPWALVMLGVVAVLVLFLGFFLPAMRFASPYRVREAAPPEVPLSIAAIDVRRNAWWVWEYHYIWRQYPRDICSAFPRLVAMVIVGLIDVGAALTVGFAFLTVFIQVTVNVWNVLPKLITALPQMAWWMITALPSAIAMGARYAASASITYQLLAAAIATALLVLFFRSKAWQLTRLWIRSKKERVCLRIRVV